MPRRSASGLSLKNFRLSDQTLDLLDRIAASYGGINRSDALRITVQEFARIRLGTEPGPAGKKRRNPAESP